MAFGILKKTLGFLARTLLDLAVSVVVLIAVFAGIMTAIELSTEQHYYDTYEEFEQRSPWFSRQYQLPIPVSADRILASSLFNSDMGDIFLVFDFPPEDSFFRDCQLIKKDDMAGFPLNWYYFASRFPEFIYARQQVRENKTINFLCHPADDTFSESVFLAIERFGPRSRARAYVWNER